MKRIFSIIISIIVISITIFSVFDIFPTKKETPLANAGVMDLSLLEFDNRNTIPLDGEWEFYPNEFIVPEKDRDIFHSYRDNMKKEQVPGPWKDYVNAGENNVVIGTYRLIVKLPKDDMYAVKTNKINYANKLYINGYPVGSSGVPSKDYSEYIGDIQMYMRGVPSYEKKIEIVFHVANYRYPTGGIVNSIDFGTMNGITYLRDVDRAKDALLIGGYIVLSVIFFFLYVREKESRYFLHFSLLTLSVCIHLSLQNERILDLIILNIGLNERSNLQISFIHYATLSFLWFAHDFLKGISNRTIMMILSLITGFHTSLYIIPPLRELILGDMPILYKQILIVSIPAVVCFYVSIILIRAFLQKRAEIEYILVIITTFLCYGFLISADFLYNIPIGQIPIILFTVMIFFLALLMESRSEHRNRYIRQLSKDLLIQDRIKDEFLAKTSVQLDYPLTKIKHIAQTLMEGKGSTLKPDQHESVMLIYRVSQRLEYIVSDLLSASEIKKGHIVMTPKPTKLTVLSHVVEEIRVFISNSKNVEIIYDISSEFPLVFVDEQRLNQIVFNLLHNAILYTTEGTIKVTATVVEQEAHVMVSDTGIGISKEEIDSIFTSFYQGENILNDESGRLGLGLTIVKQLVELSYGEIWVESELGIGSKFIFTIPLVPEGVTEQERQTSFSLSETKHSVEIQDKLMYPYKSIGTREYTVLIVGNESPEMRELIEIIQSIEISCVVANTGKLALYILDKEKIDLLILHTTLPDMSNDEMCGIVREKYHIIELPIIRFLTMGKLTSLDILSKNNGDMFLKKPLNAREVVEGIESLLAMKKSSEKSIHDELSFFHAQIIPHFLYNTLNTIIGLSYKDAKKTREALQHLAIYFRAKLNFYRRDEMIHLSKELELVESYTEIEKMRYGDRIHINFNIDDTINISIPPLTLQPLVENAIEHGLLKNNGGGRLCISVRRVTKGIEIVIEDNGVGMEEEKRVKLLTGENEGIGFTNAVKRLKLIKNMTFTLESEIGKGTKIIIILPGEKSHESHYSG